jgi:hypothetical protein
LSNLSSARKDSSIFLAFITVWIYLLLISVWESSDILRPSSFGNCLSMVVLHLTPDIPTRLFNLFFLTM